MLPIRITAKKYPPLIGQTDHMVNASANLKLPRLAG
jgi:hypothetical protein